jgi:hypothetical protein
MAEEVHVKLRLPEENSLQMVTVNGATAALGGGHADTVVIPAQAARAFEVVGRWS